MHAPGLERAVCVKLATQPQEEPIAIGRANLPMTTIGLATGGDARTGMKDTLMLRCGLAASSSSELVERSVDVARTLERDVATAADVENMLELQPVPVPS